MKGSVLILTRKDVAALMTNADYLMAVEAAFRADKEGRAASPMPMHIDGDGGAFHAKGAAFKNDNAYVALKFNGNFPQNVARFGLPTIQGAIFLCDATDGSLLAILDSIEVTLKRTAAASALAAKYLARKDARILCICGCGDQGRVQAEALEEIFPFEQAFAWDTDQAKARAFAKAMEKSLGFRFSPVEDCRAGARSADIVVAATTASQPYLTPADVRLGAFVAAVGADSPGKNEIAPTLMAASKIVADVVDQCAEMGDLRAALSAGAVGLEDVYADLGEIVTGVKPGRQSDHEIIIFDSTGTALQDVTSTALAYERAVESGVGKMIALGAA